jgi:hypothetical protein
MIARDHEPGRIGDPSPQDTTGILVGGRVAGQLAGFGEQAPPKRREDALLARPAVAADPDKLRHDVVALQITEAVSRAQGRRPWPDAKTFGGYDPREAF